MAPSPDKHYQARILERRDLSPDLWIIRIDPGGPFEFRAGQYATLGVEHEGKRIERAYSIVSSPYESELEFFVELVPHGDLTPDLFRLNKGDTLLCRKLAKGRFTVDLGSGRTNHLLISTVTGIAPCRGTTNCTASKVRAGRGNLVIAKNWNDIRTRCRGSSMCPP